MFRAKFFILVTLFVMLFASCTPFVETPAPPPPVLTDEPGVPVTGGPVAGVAVVQSVEIQLLESQPLQVNAIVRGQLPDGGCTTISDVNQVRDGNTFKITLGTKTDPLAVCTLAATPYERVIPLDVNGLPPAKYLVDVNGMEASFELLTRDHAKFNQALVEALNARNYDLLNVMMDDSFMIGYWLSEGTTVAPADAIGQLQRSLLNSSSPITADYSKNLIELLGADPVTIVDSDLQIFDVSPLFISGLGAAGRDEAILFTAKLPDGSLYWHGLLFAKDGFARPTQVPSTPIPVDMSAYPTRVEYIMAQVDVRMRSGPGMQFSVISYLAEGQTAKVTGISADGYWWRVVCPDNTIGSCWVSALRHLTLPSDEIVPTPSPDYSAYPTDVQYVTALQDVTMYGGPGTQFSTVGWIGAGQIVKVTGIDVKREWWRVICPDNSIGNCWVSVDPDLTSPTNLAKHADVQTVEIQILESYPVQINAIARGQFPDAGCTTLSSVNQTRTGNTFHVTLITTTDPEAMCAQVITPFEQVIPLDVSSLLPANYNVIVNGVEASFQLPGPVQQ